MSGIRVNIEYRGYVLGIDAAPGQFEDTLRKARIAIDNHVEQAGAREGEDDTSPKLPRYRCHKVVHAVEMTAGDYMDYQASQIGGKPKALAPQSQALDAKGYLVIYNRDTADHYESWSPADVFDAGYTRID